MSGTLIRVLAPNPSVMTGPGTNTYVIGGHDARDVMVIDPGPAGYPQHVERVADVATRHGHASAVIVTHHHLDHAGCAAETARRLEAPLLAFAHNSGPDPDRRLKDGERLSVGAERIHVLHTPGHASDHACLYWEDEGVLFAGDMVTTQGTVVISPPDGSMADYLDSLERLRDLGARQIRPGHGDPIDSPRDFLEQYIAHRLMREAKVVAALSAHPDGARAEEMLPSVYDDVSQDLYPVAARSLLAHLLKLVTDGRVLQVDGSGGDPPRYRLVPGG